MTPATAYLFVYGTLRHTSPHPMALWLAGSAKFLGMAKTPGRLYNLGAYPGLLPPLADVDWVHGDLYSLPDRAGELLVELDRYEGCAAECPRPIIFTRTQAPVTLADGTVHQAWLYLCTAAVHERQRITSGDYLSVLLRASTASPTAGP